MGTLTTKEKDALDDVFLSIHSQESSYNIFKHSRIYITKSFKVAKIGVKNTKLCKFIHFFNKKKKNLSK